jgi:hypothetical protein
MPTLYAFEMLCDRYKTAEPADRVANGLESPKKAK